MYVCMYVCVYVYIYLYMFVYMHVWIEYDVTQVCNWAIFSEETHKMKLIVIKNYKYTNLIMLIEKCVEIM